MVNELRESQAAPREPLPPLSEERSVVEFPEAPPDGGWHAWVQVLSASFLIFNSWYVTKIDIPQSANVRTQGALSTHSELTKHSTSPTYFLPTLAPQSPGLELPKPFCLSW